MIRTKYEIIRTHRIIKAMKERIRTRNGITRINRRIIKAIRQLNGMIGPLNDMIRQLNDMIRPLNGIIGPLNGMMTIKCSVAETEPVGAEVF